ncbi:type II toxin-antitoxin system toxin DNA ADP-ribosyl transferase DarT [Mucisphaera calidilacus]|uniref:DarT domain-containing protein n=1 Tax=Mucisphaera calidilacus TaxID=2527982 RepID=A0A518C192_9BACT|nr:DUF4433 domain-containing protein [Mucisphaera calidilacus]QDU72997.1 hypothetical protein Pan265_28750 [Mucisphaera calidilacus]
MLEARWCRTEMAGLNAKDGRIFRITHVNNVPWLLDNGLHCMNSPKQDLNFVPIGSQELILKRSSHTVEAEPRGTLADYIPFYFTPYSVMMYNIKTGYHGVIQRPNHEIVILTSSVHRLAELKIPFVFYDGHAYMQESTCYNSVDDLDKIDWPLLQAKDFRRDPERPEKFNRYQAEALAYRHVPIDALLGIACYNESTTEQIANDTANASLNLAVKTLPSWYF